MDAAGTSGMSFAVSESTAGGTVSMSVQVTSITYVALRRARNAHARSFVVVVTPYRHDACSAVWVDLSDPKAVSVTVSITDTGSSTVVASATVTVTFERAELVVSSPAPKSVPFGDTTFSTLTVSNAATSAVTLDATVAADSTAAWGALKDPTTNQDTASVALSLAPGDSQTLTVSLEADKLGVQEYTLDITSNDFLNPSASVCVPRQPRVAPVPHCDVCCCRATE